MLSLSLNPKDLHTNMPQFYKEILTSWYSLKRNPCAKSEILDEVLWYNKDIIVDNSMIFYPKMYDKNIIRLKDIIKENGQFMNILELKQQYNIQLNLLTLQGNWK